MKICRYEIVKWSRNFGAYALAGALASVLFSPVLRAQEDKDKGKEAEQGPKIAKVEISPKEAKAEVGSSLQFTAVAKDDTGKVVDAKVTVWFAAPFDAAGADMNGKVYFSAPGEITVGALIGHEVGLAKVMVAKPSVTQVEIEKLAAPLAVGGSATLVAKPHAADGSSRPDVAVTWKSLTPAIAKVDAAGVVTAVAPGDARIQATSEGINGEVGVHIVADTVRRLAVDPTTTTARTGDVVHFTASTKDAAGKPVKDVTINWSVSGNGATAYPDGAFVAYNPGTYEITASIGQHSGSASITVTPRNAEREIDVVAHVQPKDEKGEAIQTAEEWIIGTHAYLSTIADRVFLYDIADPANPKLLDTMKVDARLVNDVSTTPDEKLGVITREGASNRKNGIVLLDLSDPNKLQTAAEYTETVTGGVHSAFINTHYVYLTDDATGSLRVIDFQDPKHPKEVARWQVDNNKSQTIVGPEGPVTTGRYLHDLYVKDGLAYLAYWRDGLVILDVGNGMKGGSPEHPKLVSQYLYNHYELYGDDWLAGTHSTFRYKNYLFVGDEVLLGFFNIMSKERVPTRAICHVMDVSDLEHPREVAFYEVPEGGSHNFWADNDMLFLGDYGGGGRVIDISGELRGDLYRQGREIARLWTGDTQAFRANLPLTWGAQPWNGLIYINDIDSGLWIAKLGKPNFKGSTTAPPLQRKAEKTP
ncbi:MAG TPA: Ig-like domain-containing protein [Candidatus Acidoferrales bacterium]